MSLPDLMCITVSACVCVKRERQGDEQLKSPTVAMKLNRFSGK